MAVVTVDGRNLVVELPGWEKVWALKGRLTIPLSQVRGIELDPEYAARPKGIRFPGTYIPKVITAGTYLHQGEKIFWDVRDPQRSVVISLSDSGKYSKLVLQVEDPDRVVSEVRAAVNR
ncbi:hypothetical protein [Nocardia huaxiensis]|uniref:PH (Pleckstrin Homology) domain-containing protein n=1 Tax=Nocardia huaxiensis TaxID=2755382 RepID=A0A7D6VEJ6_9NOCA|nr:hypothetical protein [Nocardia huaxiensis]QLY30675.1 hypothetical protein H0264_37195 [Nocardia huaxiensis]UFS94166.1 hypothetical protein LPY97_25790 [Nocardia huaxiensis]